MRDNMIVNLSGLDGHAMAIDLNIEHNIGYLKVRLSVLAMLFHDYNRVEIEVIRREGYILHMGPSRQHIRICQLPTRREKTGRDWYANRISWDNSHGTRYHSVGMEGC